jgi:hypothetical protein
VSRCYEVRTTEPVHLPLAAFTLAADLEPVQQLARYPGGLIPLGWATDARPPAPLALPPAPPASPQLQAAASGPAGAGVPFAGGGGILGAPALPPPPALWGASEPMPPSLLWPGAGSATISGVGSQHARPGSSGGGGGMGLSSDAAAMARSQPYRGGDDSLPRPLLGGPRLYGSTSSAPVPLPGSGAGGGLHCVFSGAEDASEEGGLRGDGVRIGSPAAPVYSAARPSSVAGGSGSPKLPVLTNAASPPQLGAAGALAGAPSPGRLRDALYDSLDSGRRAVSAAAAAIADAEAAVIRSGSGAPSPSWVAAAPPGTAGSQLEPLRWSLQQSAHAVSGLAAALNAAATELNGPETGQALPTGAWAAFGDTVSKLGLPPEVAQEAFGASAAAIGGWGGDAASRELQDEVLRLRAEVRGDEKRAQPWLEGATLTRDGIAFELRTA